MAFGNENVQFCELLNIEQTVLMRRFYREEYVKNVSQLRFVSSCCLKKKWVL